MKIILGADHAGYDLKTMLIAALNDRGHEVIDAGSDSPDDSVDYPDYAVKVSKAVKEGEADKGIAICGTGIGMSMVANRIPGIRAALCYDVFTARMCREHNNANVLVLGARITAPAYAWEIVEVFLNTEFLNGRHQKRIDKIDALDLCKDELP